MELQKIDIRSLTLDQLKAAFVANGDKAFRGQQVYECLWKKSAHSFEQMSNLNFETRNWLQVNYAIHAV